MTADFAVIDEAEQLARARVVRHELMSRTLVESTRLSWNANITCFPSRPIKDDDRASQSSSRSASMSSQSSSAASFQQSSSIFGSTVSKAIAAADTSQLDEVLSALAVRRAKVAKRLASYNKIHKSGHKHLDDDTKLLVQHEAESRVDIEEVQDIWRTSLQKVASGSVEAGRVRVQFEESALRRHIYDVCDEEYCTLVDSLHEDLMQVLGVTGHVSITNSSAALPNVADVESPVGPVTYATLVAAGVARHEAHRRAQLVVDELAQRQEIRSEHQIMWNYVCRANASASPPSHHRLFDGFQAQPPSTDRIAFLKIQLGERKALFREFEFVAQDIATAEMAEWHSLDYHFNNVIRFQLSLPTSVTPS